MTYITNYGITSVGNSSALALLSTQSFTGTYEIVNTYSSVIVTIILLSAETCTLTVKFSTDGSNPNSTSQSVTLVGNQTTPFYHIFPVSAKYVQVTVLANLATAVTGFVQTNYQIDSKLPISLLTSSLNNNSDSIITRGILSGANVSGSYVNSSIDALNASVVDATNVLNTRAIVTGRSQGSNAYTTINVDTASTALTSSSNALVTKTVNYGTTNSTTTYDTIGANNIDTNNSSAVNLSGGATFTGTSTNVTKFSIINMSVFASHASATNGFSIQFSTDNVTFTTYESFNVIANSTISKSYEVTANFYRLVYVNGASAQTTFRLQSILQTTGVKTNNIRSLSNSYFSTLATTASFTGTYEDSSEYAQIIVNCKATQAGTLTINFSSGGVTADVTIGPLSLSANTSTEQPFAPLRQFYQVVYTNTSVSTSTISLETRLYVSPSIATTPVNQGITSLTTSTTVRSAIFGKTSGNRYLQTPSSSEGFIQVEINGPANAFGSLNVAQGTAVAQLTWPYGLNVLTSNTSTATGGTTSFPPSTANMRCISGTTAGGSAIVYGLRRSPSNTGVGLTCRASGLFTSPGIASTTQLIGWGDSSNGYFFGYNGTAFGSLFRRGGINQISTFTVTGAATGTGNITITLNSVAYVVAVVNGDTTSIVAYKIATSTAFNGFWEITSFGTATLTAVSLIAASLGGTYSFAAAATGVTMSAFTQTAGTSPTDTWTAQTAWNIDVMDGTGSAENPSGMLIVPSNGNVYQVQAQWLGYGNIKWFIENQSTGRFTPVHQMVYTNSNTQPSLKSQELRIYFQALNTGGGGGTSVTVQSASSAIFVDGYKSILGPRYGVSNFMSFNHTGSNIYPLIVLQSQTVFNSVINVASSQIRTLSANIGAGGAILSIYSNPLYTGGAPTFATYNTNSCMAVYLSPAGGPGFTITAPSTINGIVIYNTTVATGGGNISIDLTDLDIFISPGVTLAIGISFIATQNTSSTAAVTWNEFTSG